MTRIEEARDALVDLELRELLGSEGAPDVAATLSGQSADFEGAGGPIAAEPGSLGVAAGAAAGSRRVMEWAAVLVVGIGATIWIALSGESTPDAPNAPAAERPSPYGLQDPKPKKPLRVRSPAELRAAARGTRWINLEKFVDGELDGLRRLAELRRLTLQGGFRGVDPATEGPRLTDASLDVLQHLPKLHTLQIMLCPGFTGSRLGDLARAPMLRALEFYAQAFAPDAFEGLAKLPVLDTLTFDMCVLRDAQIEQLTRLQKLKRLQLPNTSGMTGAALAKIRLLKGLRALDLSGVVCVNLDVMRALASLPELRSLRLGGPRQNLPADLGDAELRQLRELSVRRSPLSDASIAGLLRLAPKLERLDLSHTAGVGFETMSAVRELQGLRALDLSGCHRDVVTLLGRIGLPENASVVVTRRGCSLVDIDAVKRRLKDRVLWK